MVAGPSAQTTEQRADWVVRLSEASVLDRASLRHARDLLGRVEGRPCLLVTGESNGLALRLCRSGGDWHSLHTDQEGVDLFARGHGGTSDLLSDDAFPVEEASYDAVVVCGFLEYHGNSHGVIAECHRVLKESGRLLILVPQAKPWAVARSIIKLFQWGHASTSGPVTAFSSSRMFDELKDGFDVEEQLGYGRFFLELAEGLARGLSASSVRGMRRRARQMGMAEENNAVVDRVLRVRNLCRPLLALASLLDVLLFFTGGYHMICRGRRRLWRPRRAPVLTDGRSIADATINTKIGTAAPF